MSKGMEPRTWRLFSKSWTQPFPRRGRIGKPAHREITPTAPASGVSYPAPSRPWREPGIQLKTSGGLRPYPQPEPEPAPRCWPLGPARPFQQSSPSPHQDPPPSRHSSSAPARTRLPFSPDSPNSNQSPPPQRGPVFFFRVCGGPVNLLSREPAPALLPSQHSVASLASLHSETASTLA